VPDVVVGLPFANADLHRRCRRGSIQRLDLRFLVNTQHNRVLRRLQIQPHDVGDLGNQFRIGGELKNVCARHGCTPCSRHTRATVP
jgi:hypothetical protein